MTYIVPSLHDDAARSAQLRPTPGLFNHALCAGNNNDLDLLARNACLALEICGKADGSIPVIKGAAKPLATEVGPRLPLLLSCHC